MISSLGSQPGLSATQWRQAQFQKADANADNALSKDELLASLTESPMAANGGDVSAIADRILGRQDADGDGSLSSSEFTAAPPRFSAGGNTVLLQAQEQSGTDPLFARTDADSDGSLTEAELTAAFGGAEAEGAADLAEDVLAALDGDEDGAITRAEFAEGRAAQAAMGMMGGPGSAGGPPPGGPPPGRMPASGDTDETDSASASSAGSNSLAELLAGLDSDGDGSLNLDEFSALFGGGTAANSQAGFGARLSSGTLGVLLQGNQAA